MGSRATSSGSCVVMPDRAAAGVAVVAGVGRGAERVVVLDVERLVAVQRDERGGADVAGVGAQGERLGDVDAVRRPPAMMSWTLP